MKPTLLPALAAALLLGCRQGQPTPGANQVPAEPPQLTVEFFTRDQPPIDGMSVWQSRIVVQADRFYLIDSLKATASPVALPGMTEVVALATEGSRRALA